MLYELIWNQIIWIWAYTISLTVHFSDCSKPGKWAIIYLCDRGFDFAFLWFSCWIIELFQKWAIFVCFLFCFPCYYNCFVSEKCSYPTTMYEWNIIWPFIQLQNRKCGIICYYLKPEARMENLWWISSGCIPHCMEKLCPISVSEIQWLTESVGGFFLTYIPV